MPWGQKTKTENRSNIVTNSIKTLKMVQIKKKKNFFLKKDMYSVQRLSQNTLSRHIQEIVDVSVYNSIHL